MHALLVCHRRTSKDLVLVFGLRIYPCQRTGYGHLAISIAAMVLWQVSVWRILLVLDMIRAQTTGEANWIDVKQGFPRQELVLTMEGRTKTTIATLKKCASPIRAFLNSICSVELSFNHRCVIHRCVCNWLRRSANLVIPFQWKLEAVKSLLRRTASYSVPWRIKAKYYNTFALETRELLHHLWNQSSRSIVLLHFTRKSWIFELTTSDNFPHRKVLYQTLPRCQHSTYIKPSVLPAALSLHKPIATSRNQV